jgi:hypothetical protein
MAAIDMHIFAAENVDRFMHDVYALLEANIQRRRKDRIGFTKYVLAIC